MEITVCSERTATLIQEPYTAPDITAIERFLEAHPHLVEVLIEARRPLAETFPDPHVSLEIIQDPEEPGWEQLCAYIATSLPVKAALDRLDEFDNHWFIDQLDRVDDLLNFDIECV